MHDVYGKITCFSIQILVHGMRKMDYFSTSKILRGFSNIYYKAAPDCVLVIWQKALNYLSGKQIQVVYARCTNID